MDDKNIAFNGEVQFRRYSDTSTQGQQIVFAVEDREALEPFIGKEGKRFMAVLVELGDDEQPVQQPRKDTRGPLCREACDYCVMPEFHKWLVHERGAGGVDETYAKRWILQLCDIDSRKELDTDRQAGDDFVQLVRIPFMRWQRERKV
jgi:hypothetical protein